jgi:CRP-like cAMP-binding protein
MDIAGTDRSSPLSPAAGAQARPTNSASLAQRSFMRVALVGPLPTCRPGTIETLIDSARIRSVRANDAIYRQGEPVPLTLILDGFGTFRRITLTGHDLSSGIGRPCVLFGFSCMASVVSSVELVAVTDCHVAQWTGAEIRALAGNDPGLAIDAVDSIATSLHVMIERIEGFLHQDARRRVIRILARYQDLFFGDPATLTRGHLPALIGTSREMTGRVLRQLEREGTIERVGHTGLKLLRPDLLEAGAAQV